MFQVREMLGVAAATSTIIKKKIIPALSGWYSQSIFCRTPGPGYCGLPCLSLVWPCLPALLQTPRFLHECRGNHLMVLWFLFFGVLGSSGLSTSGHLPCIWYRLPLL